MEENKATIKVYTFLFLFVIFGFIGFLIYQGIRDADYKGRISPNDKHKKGRSESTLTISAINKV